jgi:hypothetical protein
MSAEGREEGEELTLTIQGIIEMQKAVLTHRLLQRGEQEGKTTASSSLCGRENQSPIR